MFNACKSLNSFIFTTHLCIIKVNEMRFCNNKIERRLKQLSYCLIDSIMYWQRKDNNSVFAYNISIYEKQSSKIIVFICA